MSYQKYFEMLWDDECDIIEQQEVTDPVTKRTTTVDVKVNDEPIKCKLSYKEFPEAKDGVVNGIKQLTKLFINPQIEIKEGSKIVVTHKGRTVEYENSGKPAIYSYHQEINLKAVQKRA